MPSMSMLQKDGKLRRATIIAAIWLGVALFFSLQRIVGRVTRDQSIDWVNDVGAEFLYWLPWMLLTPVLLYAVRRWPLEPATWRRHVWPHFGIAGAVSAVQTSAALVLQFLAALAIGRDVRWEMLAQRASDSFPILFLTAFWKYWVFVGVFYSFHYYSKFKDREQNAARLEAKLATARLQALKGQLHPHFLFNTLHSVSMLNLTDTDQANRILVLLSELLRKTLDSDGSPNVTLAEELDLVDRYLEIERTRFGDRLTVSYEIDDRVESAVVPSLILQPIVENAVRHGVANRSGEARIAVRAVAEENRLVLTVTDNGPGIPPGWSIESNSGIGLSNTIERLAVMYGDAGTLTLSSAEPSGTESRITIPLTFESSERPA